MFRFHRLTTVLFLISLGFSSVYAQVTIDSENPLTVTPTSIPSGTITFDSGTLTVQVGTTTLTNAVAVGGVNTIDSQARLILNGTLTGSGSITKTGNEQLHFGGDASGFSGTVTIASSWGRFLAPKAASGSATYVLGTALSNQGFVFTTVSSTAAGANTFQLGMLESTNTNAVLRVSSGMPSDATLQIGGTNTDGSFAGKFLDESGKKLNIEKVGTGTWTWNNPGAYNSDLGTGTLKITAGTLRLGDADGKTTGHIQGFNYTDAEAIPTKLMNITVEKDGTLEFNRTDSGLLRLNQTTTWNGGTLKMTGSKAVVFNSVVDGTEMNVENTGGGNLFFQKCSYATATLNVKQINFKSGNSILKCDLPNSADVGGTATLQLGRNDAGNISVSGTIQVSAGGTLNLGEGNVASVKLANLTLKSGGIAQANPACTVNPNISISNVAFQGGTMTGKYAMTLGNIDLKAETTSIYNVPGYSNINGTMTGSGTLNFDAAVTGTTATSNQLHISGNANVSGKEFAGTIVSQNGGYVAFRSTSSTSSKAKYQSTGNGNIVFLATETDKATFKLGELSSTGNCEVRSLMANECRAITLEVGGANTDAEFKGYIKDYPHGSVMDIYSVTKVGTGTWTLSANQEFTGPTNVNGGTLCINGNYKSPVYVNNGGTLTGVGTFLNGVEVKINAGGNLKRSMNQDVTLNGGTFAGTYNLTNVRLADGVTSYAVPSGKAYIKGKLSGTGTLSVNGSGNISNQLWLQGDNSSFTGTIISDKNSYVCLYGGKTSSASAKYQVTNSGPNKGNCGGFIFVSTTTDSGIYELGELSGGGEFRGGNDNKKEQITLKVGGLNTDATFSGYIYDCNVGITGSLSVEKVGTGSWTLTGKNEYTGSTTVSGGELIIGEGGSITQTSSITVKDGAQFKVDGSLTSTTGITVEKGGSVSGVGEIKAPITFEENASYSLNLTDSTTLGSILSNEPLKLTGTISGPLTFDLIGDEESMKAFETAQGNEIVTFDALTVITNQEIEMPKLNNMTPGVYSLTASRIEGGYLLTVTGSLNPNAVPEPAAWILLLLGAGFLLRSGRSVSRRSSESF